MKRVTILQTLLLMGALIASVSSLATQVDMLFHGTLIVPPVCTINNGGQIAVNFGDRIGIKKINGINYQQDLNYKINCGGGTPNNAWSMVLTLNGTQASFDAGVLNTDKSGLGIKMMADGNAIRVNHPLIIQRSSPPKLTVVPVRDPKITPTAGAFSATATLSVTYQ